MPAGAGAVREASAGGTAREECRGRPSKWTTVKVDDRQRSARWGGWRVSRGDAAAGGRVRACCLKGVSLGSGFERAVVPPPLAVVNRGSVQ